MNYKEEQELELEALEAIFAHEDELELHPYAYPKKGFRLNLLPFPDNEDENHIALAIEVKYPETYPEVVPILKVINENKTEASDQKLNDINHKTCMIQANI